MPIPLAAIVTGVSCVAELASLLNGFRKNGAQNTEISQMRAELERIRGSTDSEALQYQCTIGLAQLQAPRLSGIDKVPQVINIAATCINMISQIYSQSEQGAERKKLKEYQEALHSRQEKLITLREECEKATRDAAFFKDCGKALMYEESFYEAIQHYEPAVAESTIPLNIQGRTPTMAQKNSHAENLRLLGVSYYHEGMYRQSLKRLQEALTYWPEDKNTLNYLAFCLIRSGKVEEAIASFDRSLEIDINQSHIWAQYHFLKKDYARAEIAIYDCFSLGLYDIDLHKLHTALHEAQAKSPDPVANAKHIKQAIEACSKALSLIDPAKVSLRMEREQLYVRRAKHYLSLAALNTPFMTSFVFSSGETRSYVSKAEPLLLIAEAAAAAAPINLDQEADALEPIVYSRIDFVQHALADLHAATLPDMNPYNLEALRLIAEHRPGASLPAVSENIGAVAGRFFRGEGVNKSYRQTAYHLDLATRDLPAVPSVLSDVALDSSGYAILNHYKAPVLQCPEMTAASDQAIQLLLKIYTSADPAEKRVLKYLKWDEADAPQRLLPLCHFVNVQAAGGYLWQLGQKSSAETQLFYYEAAAHGKEPNALYWKAKRLHPKVRGDSYVETYHYTVEVQYEVSRKYFRIVSSSGDYEGSTWYEISEAKYNNRNSESSDYRCNIEYETRKEERTAERTVHYSIFENYYLRKSDREMPEYEGKLERYQLFLTDFERMLVALKLSATEGHTEAAVFLSKLFSDLFLNKIILTMRPPLPRPPKPEKTWSQWWNNVEPYWPPRPDRVLTAEQKALEVRRATLRNECGTTEACKVFWVAFKGSYPSKAALIEAAEEKRRAAEIERNKSSCVVM